MSYTTDSALDDGLVTVIARDDDLGEYEIRLGELETKVTVRLARLMTSNRTRFETSHVVKTPIQGAPYYTNEWIGEYPAHALRKAVRSLTLYFRMAMNEGHTPQEAWLVRVRAVSGPLRGGSGREHPATQPGKCGHSGV